MEVAIKWYWLRRLRLFTLSHIIGHGNRDQVRHSPELLFPIAEDAMLADRMRRVQDGDRAAYEIVLRHSRDAFVRLAGDRGLVGAAEHEVVCRCLDTVHRARHTFDAQRPFSAWLSAIARHHGIGADHVGTTRRSFAWIRLAIRGSRSAERNAGAEGGAA